MTPLRKYTWLINLLQQSTNGLTFEEINEEWLKYCHGSEDENIPILKRTFFNHIKAIRQEYGIQIECGTGYRYYIADADRDTMPKVNLLNTLSLLSEVVSDRQLNSNLFLGESLDIFRDSMVIAVMNAIKNKRKVVFSKFRDVNKPDKYLVLHVAPFQLHYIYSQWYVIGETDEFGLMRIPLNYYLRGGARNTDVPYQFPTNYSAVKYNKILYGTTHEKACLTIKIKTYDPHELNFENHPLSPFQQNIEYRTKLDGESTIKYIVNNYVKIDFELPQTPFALSTLKARLEKYRYEILNAINPFMLFTKDQYFDAMNKPEVI